MGWKNFSIKDRDYSIYVVTFEIDRKKLYSFVLERHFLSCFFNWFLEIRWFKGIVKESFLMSSARNSLFDIFSSTSWFVNHSLLHFFDHYIARFKRKKKQEDIEHIEEEIFKLNYDAILTHHFSISLLHSSESNVLPFALIFI